MPSLYTTLPVHNDGTVRLCCLDGFRVTNMGNVFKDGLEKVWHGKEFTKARGITKKENGIRFHFVRTVTDGLNMTMRKKLLMVIW